MNNTSTLLATAFLMLLNIQIAAQVYDFEDAVIPSVWAGDRMDFQVSNSNQLQLNAPAGSAASSLSWPSIHTQNCSWEFYLKYAFAASTTNYATLYLFSTEANFTSMSNVSYYLKIGGVAGNADKIELIYQQGTNKKIILESRAGIVGSSTVTCRIQIVKSAAGIWELKTDTTGSFNYIKEASAQHWITNAFNYSGIHCVYSSTRRDKFYFDDISIYEPLSIEGYAFQNDSILEIHFNKSLASEIQPVSTFDFNMPATILQEGNYLLFIFSEAIRAGVYKGAINNVFSVNGDALINPSLEIIKEQTYYVGQLRISEWMSDPSPTYGLPEVEWIELINMSDQVIDLSKISLSDPTSKVRLSSYSLLPDSVVIVCSANACFYFAKQNCIEVSSLPSLNNSADSIFIWANDTLLIDFVWYDLSTMAKDFRKNGGYSIIRTEYPEECYLSQKIDFAQDNSGGSPGFGTSVLRSKPLRIEATIVSEKEVNLTINMNAFLFDTSFYSLIGVRHTVNNQYKYGTSCTLYLDKELEAGNRYDFMLHSMRTCRNQIKHINAEIEVIYPKQIEKNEVFLNEILYNPKLGGVDFIELYNTTSNYIQFQNSHFYNETAGTLQHMFFSENTIIAPLDFIILTSDTAILKRQYNNTISTNAFQRAHFLSLPDTGGKLIWLDASGDTLDRISYGDAYQNPLHRNTEGYSQEKIQSSESVFSSSNWTTSAVYATPGYVNSQQIQSNNNSPKPFYCNPCHVTTNLNGINDYAMLYLGETARGCFGSIGIYRVSGEKVTDLIVNQLLGHTNVFQWNGEQQGGGLLEDGIYIAVAEWWSSDGKTFISKIALSTSQY